MPASRVEKTENFDDSICDGLPCFGDTDDKAIMAKTPAQIISEYGTPLSMMIGGKRCIIPKPVEFTPDQVDLVCRAAKHVLEHHCTGRGPDALFMLPVMSRFSKKDFVSPDTVWIDAYIWPLGWKLRPGHAPRPGANIAFYYNKHGMRCASCKKWVRYT